MGTSYLDDLDEALVAEDAAQSSGVRDVVGSGPATPVPVDPTHPSTDDIRAALSQAPGSSFRAQSLVNKAPIWYEQLARPKQSAAAAGLGAALPAIAEGAQRSANLSAKEPLRRYKLKARDQDRANMLSVLGSGASALLNKPQADYDADLAAASKQAQMNATLSSGRNAADQNALGWANYGLAKDRLDRQTALDAQTAQRIKDSQDPMSQASKDAQEAAVRGGLVRAEEAGQYSAAQLEKFRTALMQRQSQDWRGNEADRVADRSQADRISMLENEQQAKLAGEQRKSAQEMEQMSVPGVRFRTAPTPETYKKAQETELARKSLVQNNRELGEIQKKISDKSLLLGAIGENDIVRGLSNDREAAALLQRAKLLQTDNSNKFRKLAEYGVLSGREAEMADARNLKAGTPQALLNGDVDFNENAQFWDDYGRSTMRGLGGLYEDDPEAKNIGPNVIQRAQAPRFAKPQVQRYNGGQAPQQQGEVPPSQMPVDDDAPTASGVYRVTLPSGKVATRPLSQEEYEKLVSRLGANNVQRVQ